MLLFHSRFGSFSSGLFGTEVVSLRVLQIVDSNDVDHGDKDTKAKSDDQDDLLLPGEPHAYGAKSVQGTHVGSHPCDIPVKRGMGRKKMARSVMMLSGAEERYMVTMLMHVCGGSIGV